MLRSLRNPVASIAIAALASVGIGGCNSNQLAEIGAAGTNLVPRVDRLARPDWLTYSGGKQEFTLRPVTAADLVSAEGQCPLDPQVSSGGPDPAAVDGVPTIPGGIALQMTECDVVRRAGAPDQVQIGGDERGERSVVITYTRGPRPGTYRFAAGRLQAIERAPGASPPAVKQKSKARKTT